MLQGYELNLEQSQKLVMTPELIQAIKILQFTSQELDTYVGEQLLTNPVLETEEQGGEHQAESSPAAAAEDVNTPVDSRESPVGKDEAFDWAEHIREKDYDDISYRQTISEPNDYTYEQYVSNDVSLAEYLMTQLQFIYLDRRPCKVAKYIIEALDENGYLSQELSEIAALSGVPETVVKKALRAVQSLDPAGVGARDLKECLLLQLERGGEDTDIAKSLVAKHLEDIASNRISSIARELGITIAEAQAYCDVIRSLEPKPGRQFGSAQDNRYIIADATVENVDGEYIVIMNERSTPRLTISSYYKRVLDESSNDPQITEFLGQRMNSAMWLIKSIEQRRRTIQSVVMAIVERQKAFLDDGPMHIRPMTLAEIADDVGIHESTVSRSVNGKYVQTPRGLYELRYFFTGGLSGARGETVASGSVKEYIRELVAGEDEKNPYSDQLISELMMEKRGIAISRRTVAKYRDELGIASSSKRKRY